MNTTDYTIRLEKEEDHHAVENLVRESFWNVYRPGCSEHYVIHVLRDDPAFVKELDFVMHLRVHKTDPAEQFVVEQEGRLIGQNMFMKTIIESDDGRTIPVLTMGPIGITPELKRKGFGKILLDYSLEKAAEMGFGAVLFEGNIGFYSHCGFSYARNFGIRYHDLPDGADDSFFLCKELIPGYLDDVTGVYQTPQGYYVKDEDVEAFDKGFPPKEKQKLPGQIFG
ncbi:MAG: N-acetyltransferase [Lachnospiraceae bacterium]|nr:N-acetyltransferase [Lachnospiraceae bacterium]